MRTCGQGPTSLGNPDFYFQGGKEKSGSNSTYFRYTVLLHITHSMLVCDRLDLINTLSAPEPLLTTSLCAQIRFLRTYNADAHMASQADSISG